MYYYTVVDALPKRENDLKEKKKKKKFSGFFFSSILIVHMRGRCFLDRPLRGTAYFFFSEREKRIRNVFFSFSSFLALEKKVSAAGVLFAFFLAF